ncbi:unnamed protein product [Rotaria sp. Silwood1]|nr:unnamed protein product [Rotaria sp. Silwood1]CAF1312027.1 unnamed protein product [Rotaria sp. Silwood1]CAF3521447.1 unnamed protein product [Rotaria sp. Silwood1]CAF3523131.1 unnamed protein product [Rotaria sp. Silwood1]CAF3557218.1 unnamed protein product [Rotaria sp. Silwood1]
MTDVTTIRPGTVFAWFMLVLVVRRLALIIMLIVTRQTQPFQPSVRLPEDDTRKKKQMVSSAESTPQNEVNRDARINGVITNDAENDTYFLVLLLATALFSDWVNGNVIRTIVYGAIYAFARIVHSVTYLLALQPWRSLAYMIGLLCTFAINLDLVITMSRRTN